MYITNPALPYCCSIGTRLSVGSLIRVQGTVNSYATCFAINLQFGPSVNPRDDVALHLSPVFTPPPRIVRNSISGNRWGPEESFGGFPLSVGSSFEFMILVEASEFKIALNGVHFTEFRHRLPFERITHIAIDGDVQIHVLKVEASPYASASAPPLDPYGASGGAPYPTGGGGPGFAPGLYPPLGPSGGYSPTHQPNVHPYVAPSMPATGGAAYPATSGYPTAPGGYPSGPGAYPSAPGGYPSAPGGYPQAGGYPSGSGYPAGNAYPPPPPGYPQTSSNKQGGIGGMLGTALGGVGLGAAATAIGSNLFGNKHKQPHYPGSSGGMLGGIIPGMGGSSHHSGGHKSNPIPIGTIAAGAGAAALGAALLTGHHPLKKVKKVFKHKHKMGKFGKFGKFKHKGWHHKGWSSGSSSEEE